VLGPLQNMCKDAFDSRFTRTPNSRKSALVRSFAVYGMLVTGLDVQLFALRRPFPGGYSFGREADFSVPLKLGGLTELQQLFRVVCTVAALVGMLEAHCGKDEDGSNDGNGDGNGNRGGGGGGDSRNADDGGGDDSGGGSPRDGGNGPGWGGPSVPPTRPTPQKPSKKQSEGKGRARGVLSDPPAWLANEQRPRHKFERDVWALPTRRETCRIELVSLEGKPCVLKVYDLRPSWTLALANAELQVLLAARRLGLPHVVRLIDVFIDDTVGPELVFVLPRLQGVDARFARGIIDNVEVGLRKLGANFSQLLRGLAGLHAAGFAHGDVSPNNVMLDSDSGSLVWIDFGYSRVTSQCGPRQGCGTPGFIAPDSPTDCVTGTEPDVWALGCLLGRALADVVASLPGSSRWSPVCGVLARAGRDPDELACLPELIASVGAPGLGEKAVVAGVCLVARLTESNVARRLTAAQALDDCFFQFASETCASSGAGKAVVSARLPLQRIDNHV
jgi:serine/threonine protein kinase